MNKSHDTASLLDRFPKKRIALPPAYREIYEKHYLSNRNGSYATTAVSQKLERWMHLRVARDMRMPGRHRTLEIGAGTLNQLAFEQGHEFYEIVEPFEALFLGSPVLSRVQKVYSDISDIPPDTRYDRITSIATFEHIMDLPAVVASACLLLADQGHLRVAIPNEGTILWKLGTRITGAEFTRKYGLDYQVLMQYEHVNTADDIEQVLRYFFSDVSCAVFGISRRYALYRFLDCVGPNRERSASFLERRRT